MSDEFPAIIPTDTTSGDIIQGEFLTLDTFHAGFGTMIVEDEGATPCLILGLGISGEVLPVLIPGGDALSFFTHLKEIEKLWIRWQLNPKSLKNQEAEEAELAYRVENDDPGPTPEEVGG